MKARMGKRTKDEAILISSAAHTVDREGKMLMRKSKGVARKTKNAVARNLKRSKLARATRRGLRRATSAANRAVRRGTAKGRSARRVRVRK